MNFIIVWCEHVSGLVSTRASRDNKPIIFTFDQVNSSSIPVCFEHEDVFAILGKKDAERVAIPVGQVEEILGWKLDSI